MSQSKQNITEALISMGFQKNYIVRAFKVYEKTYGHSYNIEVITEIIIRLQNKDKAKKSKKRKASPNINNIIPPNKKRKISNPPRFITNNQDNTNTILNIQHMTLEQANKLRINDKLDHCDLAYRFVSATVTDKQGTHLKIHYDGWSRKWDTWSDFSSEIHRFA
eukprot:708832_1